MLQYQILYNHANLETVNFVHSNKKEKFEHDHFIPMIGLGINPSDIIHVNLDVIVRCREVLLSPHMILPAIITMTER